MPLPMNGRERAAYDVLTKLPYLLCHPDGVAAVSGAELSQLMREVRDALSLFQSTATPVTPIERGFADAKPMTFREFQAVNAERVPVYGKKLHDLTLREWCCELAEETGEVCGVAKKRSRKPDPARPGYDVAGKKTPTISDLADELGDVIAVAAIIAQHAGIDLELAVRAKWNSVSERLNYPVRI